MRAGAGPVISIGPAFPPIRDAGPPGLAQRNETKLPGGGSSVELQGESLADSVTGTYERSGTGWVSNGAVIAADSVSLGQDGQVLGPSRIGTGFVEYDRRSGSTWVFEGLTFGIAVEYGRDVAFASGTKEWMFVGEPDTDTFGVDGGAVWFYRYDGSSFSHDRSR